MRNLLGLNEITRAALVIGLIVHAPRLSAQDADAASPTVDEATAPPSLPSATVAAEAGGTQAIPAPPSPDALGGAGESCRARSDCAAGLRCIANVCRDPLEGTACGASSDCGPHLRCVQQTCQSPLAPLTVQPGSSEADAEPTTIRGVHGFIGTSLMVGPTLSTSFGAMDVTLLGALRGGIYADLHEIALEVTPFSLVYGFDVPVFQLNATYGYLIPLVRGSNAAAYWPLRIGVGLLTGNTQDRVYVVGRADVLGFAVQIGQLMLDFHLPSFRVAIFPGSTYGSFGRISSSVLLHWSFGASASYVF